MVVESGGHLLQRSERLDRQLTEKEIDHSLRYIRNEDFYKYEKVETDTSDQILEKWKNDYVTRWKEVGGRCLLWHESF